MAEYREAYLFRLECDPPAYMWSGAGDLVVEGDTYLGGGELLGDIGPLQQLINGTAQRVDFTVSGVDQETIRLALEDRASVNGATVRIGTVTFDANWQLDGTPQWEWEGVADVVTVDRSGDQDGNITRSVGLSVGSEDTARSRFQLTFFTDADQRKRSPDDAIFNYVAGITQGKTRRFGGG